MRNFVARAAYDGSGFHGFQRQENAVTVQETIETALSKLFGAKTEIIGCSRTDSGVHAFEYVFNFFSETKIPVEKLAMAVNSGLDNSRISVINISEADLEFHARYSCKGKRYVYNVWNCRLKNPFTIKYSWHVPQKLDFEAMEKGAGYFVGRRDFSAFMSSGSDIIDTVRTINACEVLRSGIWKEQIEIEVEADGFLYNMVRIIAGTLVDVGRYKISADDIPKIISECSRKNSGVTAPARGLFLKKVYY